MNKKGALEQAEGIAKLIKIGTNKLKRIEFRHLPVFSTLPWIKYTDDLKKDKGVNPKVLDSTIFEILIFGSVANKDNGSVGDIDMVLIDNGFYSTFFKCGCENEDWYHDLKDNLDELLNGWFELGTSKIEEFWVPDIIDVDLHILPVKLFKSREFRQEVANKHKDPEFLNNCFGTMLRYFGGKFVPVNLPYFEKRFGCELSDLK